eukprot:CAMPEP_0181396702 /NCGR_PEP_ID=MMETSP1110-20121109/53_1 /TAXON_ID=174948 /ORGANISM="Symbiodinium sp., Strain CCMP421" /LENGTH=412 /DNA_ID=CAMNT_0023518413 /DNA_START=62 /DNA_END=1300 /DNA_ORIENTATION=+
MQGTEAEIEVTQALHPSLDTDLELLEEVQEPLHRPQPSCRVPWRVAGAAVLVLGLVALPMLRRSSGHSFLDGVGEDAWHALEAQLDGDQLPTMQLAHFNEEAGDVLCVADVAQGVARIMALGAFIKGTTVACDFDRIKRVLKRGATEVEQQRCASLIFGVMFQAELGMGVIASSVSTCSGSLNVPANCAANIGAFTGALGVFMQSTLAYDANCVNKGVTPQQIVSREEAKLERRKTELMHEATKWLKNRGADVSVLPSNPAVPKDVVYGAINRCVFQLDLGATFVMRAGIILGDMTIHCAPDADAGRVCAIDVTGLIAVLSLITRFFALAANSCINIVGDADRGADCVGIAAGIPAGVMAMTSSGMNLQAACQKAFDDWDPNNWPKNEKSIVKGSEKLSVPAEDGNTIIAEP